MMINKLVSFCLGGVPNAARICTFMYIQLISGKGYVIYATQRGRNKDNQNLRRVDEQREES